MEKSIASLFFIVITLFCISPSWASYVGTGGVATTANPDPVLVKKWEPYNGKKISRIVLKGLIRTREQTARWLMSSTEGQSFSSYQFAVDVQTLLNSGNLYDISTLVAYDPEVPDKVQVTVTVTDKWTLLPVVGGQGGGGAYTYGGGLYDSNLLGTFTLAQALLYNYNGVLSYDVYFYNEFIAGTQTMASLDWSNNVNPTVIHNINDSSAGSFSWQRQQEELMVGTHLPGPVRIQIFGDYYFDSLLNSSGVNISVFPGNQYRLHPVVILDRVNIVEFLEEGQEITLQPSTANFFGPVQAYQGFDIRYKKVFRVGEADNLALDFFAGAMSQAPAPYEYQVGGYLNLRGYSDSRQVGPYTALGNIEYRPFIYKHRFGRILDADLFDVDLVALQACIFSDFGSAWGDSTLTGDPGTQELNVLWSAGVGFRVNFLHYAGAILRLDLARTIRPDEGWGLSFGVGQFF